MGRHDRRDPSAVDRPARGGALRDPVLRPARDRPAVDGRPARAAAATPPRPAAPVAAADGRGGSGHGLGRRHLAKRCRGPAAAAAGPGQAGTRAGPPAATDPTRAAPPPRGEFEPAPRTAAGAPLRHPGGRGIVGVEPAGPATIVDGGAEGLAALAAFGALPERRPILYAGDLTDERSCAARPPRRGGGGHRLEPAPALRPRVRPAEPRRDAARDRAAGRELRADRARSRSAAATPRPWPRSMAPATCARPTRAACSSSPSTPRSPPSTAISPRPGPPTATSCPSARWIEVGFDRAARRAVRRARCRPGTRSGSSARSTSTASGRSSGPGGTGSGWGWRTSRPLRDHDHRGRPARGQPARRRRLSRDPDSRRADPPAAAAADDRRRGRWPAATSARGPELRVRAHDRRRAVPARPPGRQPAARAGRPTARTPSARSHRVVFAPARSLLRAWRRGCSRRWTRPTRTSTGSWAPGGSTGSTPRGAFDNQPRYRASSAFDGRPGTAWVGIWAPPGAQRPYVAWRRRGRSTVSRLRLSPRSAADPPPDGRAGELANGRSTRPLRVGPDGTVDAGRGPCGRAVSGSRCSPSRRQSGRRAQRGRSGSRRCGCPGCRPSEPPHTGRFAPVRQLSVSAWAGGRSLLAARAARSADLEAGCPLRARGCGAPGADGGGHPDDQRAAGPLRGRSAAHALARPAEPRGRRWEADGCSGRGTARDELGRGGARRAGRTAPGLCSGRASRRDGEPAATGARSASRCQSTATPTAGVRPATAATSSFNYRARRPPRDGLRDLCASSACSCSRLSLVGLVLQTSARIAPKSCACRRSPATGPWACGFHARRSPRSWRRCRSPSCSRRAPRC